MPLRAHNYLTVVGGKKTERTVFTLPKFTIPDGYYLETTFRFRYFISEGEGTLTFKGESIPVNRFQEIDADNFVLTYQSLCDERQQLDFVFEDSFGQRVEYTIEFSNEQVEEEQETSNE